MAKRTPSCITDSTSAKIQERYRIVKEVAETQVDEFMHAFRQEGSTKAKSKSKVVGLAELATLTRICLAPDASLASSYFP
jgi:hypothetical protein